MAERLLVILKRSAKTPATAMCDRCHLKLFTPRKLTHKPEEAEVYLREKFKRHECEKIGLMTKRRDHEPGTNAAKPRQSNAQHPPTDRPVVLGTE
jgi:hypothetical protein